MRRIVISGAYGHANIGDEAILSALLMVLQSMIPDVSLTVLSYDPVSVGKHYGVTALNQIPSRPSSKGFYQFALSPGSREEIWNGLGEIRRADLFVIGGGGLLHDYWTSRKALWLDKFLLYGGSISHWAAQTFMAKAMGKPVMLYAVGVGPVNTKLGKLLMRHVVNKADLITVRDQASKQALDALGINGVPVHVTADPAVLLSPADPKVVDRLLAANGIVRQGGPLIGISVRSWFSYSLKDRALAQERELWFQGVIAQVADRLIRELGAQIVFVPMQRYRKPHDDVSSSRNIVRLMKHGDQIRIITQRCTPEETMGLLGRMDLVIGMRLHSLILAAAMNVPVIGITYDPKVSSFLEAIDQGAWGVKVESISPERLFAMVESSYYSKAAIKETIRTGIKLLKQRALWNAELVLEMLGDKRNSVRG